MTKARKRKAKRPTAGELKSRDSSRMIESLFERFSVPLDELPPPIRDAFKEATRQAAEGDLEMISHLIEIIDHLDDSIGGDSSVGIPRLALCSDAAAEVLARVDPDDGMESLQAAALEAIRIDPDAVDAIVLLGDAAATREERVARYRQASEAATRKDRKTVAAVMPYVRLHMAHRLIDDGYVSDAGEILLPALDEDRQDLAEARYTLVDVCLRLGWHDELADIADRFCEDELGPVDFARALLSFARSGKSRRANALLRAAIEKHPGVAEYISGVRSMPRGGDPVTAARRDAAHAAEYLRPGMRELEGSIAWIREAAGTSLLDVGDEPDFEDDDAFTDDAFTDDELRELGRRDPLGTAIDLPTGNVTWQLVTERHTDRPGYMTVLLEEGELVAANEYDHRPGTRDLRDFVLSSVVEPISGRPRKPMTIRVPTKADVNALAKSCGTYGVTIKQGKLNPIERRRLKPAMDLIAKQLRQFQGGERDVSNESVESLPATDETWLYGVFQPPLWIHDGPSPRRMFVQLVVDSVNGFVLQHEITESAPSQQEMVETMRSAMVSPAVGDPRSAGHILIDPRLNVAGEVDVIAFTLSEQIPGTEFQLGDLRLTDYFSEVVAEMLLHNGPTNQAIKDLEGLDSSTIEEFYRILANFYRAKPWKMVGGDQLFDVTCSAWSIPKRTACVIGQLGQELGIVVYEDPRAARQLIGAGNPGNEMACGGATAVHFGEDFDTIPVDEWYRERNAWVVAGNEAHPFVARFVDMTTIRCVSADDVRMLMQILPAVPRFLDHPRDVPFELDATDGKLTLEWV